MPGLTGGSAIWMVTEDPGSIIRFILTDSAGTIITSKWEYADPAVTTASVRSMSMTSVASAMSTQAYVSRLSVSAQGVLATGSTSPSSTSPPERQNFAPIIGGILGGVALLLTIALVIFWRLRRAYPRPDPGRNEHSTAEWSDGQQGISNLPPAIPYDGTAAGTGNRYGGWGLNATDRESNVAQVPLPYNPYQPRHSPPVASRVPRSVVQPQPQHGTYGGLPEIQGGQRLVR
ncbi:hypothetical protein FRC07_006903 [Ceratobasidium sp. 392]|nr:hypothetical protein FRC07_006903 [Ceratobasidium sp. 392]